MKERTKDRQTATEREREAEESAPCCGAGPSPPPVIPGWSRPAAVISPELSEATAYAAGEKERDEGITVRNA